MNARVLLTTTVMALLAPAGAGAQQPIPHRYPVQLLDAWVRAQPSAAGQSVLYGTLVNDSDEDWTITSVVCERVRRPEIHESVMREDMVTMRRVPELRILKGQRVELRPGGLHLMLMGLEAPLAPGEHVSCTFMAGTVAVARDRGTVRAP